MSAFEDTFEPQVYTEEAFPHGLRCIDCDRPFVEGQPISERLIGMGPDATFVVELCCAECILETPPDDS